MTGVLQDDMTGCRPERSAQRVVEWTYNGVSEGERNINREDTKCSTHICHPEGRAQRVPEGST